MRTCAASLLAGLVSLATMAPMGAQESTHSVNPVCRSAVPRAERLEGRGCLVVELHAGSTILWDFTVTWPGGGTLQRADAPWRRLVEADVVLLGEVHDNDGHFRRRARLIKSIIDARSHAPAADALRGALAFEHVRADQQSAIDAFLAERVKVPPEEQLGAQALMQRLGITGSQAWPQQAELEKLIDAALAERLTLVAADPPREILRAAARGGLAAVPEAERRRLGLDVPLEDQLERVLIETLKASHCGMLPETALAGMATAQRLRDAHMAAALDTAVKRWGKAFLIAGNEHVRGDRGVPWHLARHHPHIKVATVMLVEAPDGAHDWRALVPRDPRGRPAADAILFTAAAERGDPCEAMRRHMQGRPAGKAATDK